MIKAEMKYELSDMKALSMRSLNSLPFYISVVFSFIIVIFILPAEILSLKNGINIANILFLAGVCLIIYNIVRRLVILPKKNLKTITRLCGDTSVVFTFEENVLNVSVCNAENTENTNIKYTNLYAAKEINDYFFISLSEYSVYVVKKDSFTEGTPEELREILRKNLGKKFRCAVKNY